MQKLSNVTVMQGPPQFTALRCLVEENGPMLSTLNVIDAYMTGREDADFSTVSGRDIEQFGERVREFSAAQEPKIDKDLHPIYLGGWPSANFALLNGDLILSSLLYSGQVLVRDPIADWFSEEQYRIEHMVTAAAGFRAPDDDVETRTHRTRAFLSVVIPQLVRFRPLIEAGIVVPVPTEPLFFQQQSAINALRQKIRQRLPLTPHEYSSRFDAAEIATESNVRGFFVMAPGPNPSPQIERAIGHGIRYFAREYTLANTYGVTYTASFAHENYLCREAISPIVSSSSRVVEAVLRSGLPVFHGLTPRVVRDIHDDDAFAAFRSTLHKVYQGTPVENSEEAEAYIHDQESALLRPIIEQGEKAATTGYLGRLGASLTSNKYGIAAALATDLTLGTAGVPTAIGVAGVLLDERSRSRKSGVQRIWSSLVKHNRTAGQEVQSIQVGGPSKNGPNWGIPTEPSRSVTVTTGQMIVARDAPTLWNPATDEDARARLGIYGPCRCGSGKKFKFCCAGIR